LQKITSLKLSSSILFWFGIIFQIIVGIGATTAYYLHGTIGGITTELIFSEWFGTLFILYTLFGHCLHITAAYWISKGRIKGIILGLGISVYEIVPFLFPDSALFTTPGGIPIGIPIRILFVVVILLIIYGRTSHNALQSEHWRPWNNPKATARSHQIQT